ncbi:MAG: phosphate regulon sensor histidine kinase PhoR [Burkholderiales bacterium]|nr:phosphate regulon sensor histidine kinase PhoR [Burkholderiales bacterium]
MPRFWLRIIPQLLFAGGVALLIWAADDAVAALAFLVACLLIPYVRMNQKLDLVDEWLDSPGVENVPEGNGVWGGVYSRLRRMVREFREERHNIESQFQDLQEAIAALPDAIVILDAGDHIESCNPMAEEYFGLDKNRDIGQQISYLIRQPQFVGYLSEQATNFEHPCVLKLAGERILSIQLIPYSERKKLLLARDITRLENVERMRRDFVANVSHELRTPLTVVSGFLETISDMDGAPDPAMLKRSLMLMTGQADRMKRLIEDLLTLSRLENAENVLVEEDVNVKLLLKQIQQDALSLSASNHVIELDIDTEAGLRGSADELRSGFGNLVSNAVRYTPKGGKISITWKMEGKNAVFSVKDSGIGIEPEHIPRLTERFYRVDKSRSRGTGGTGLGLAIVKHVLNRHHGRLEVTSQIGKGSVFRAIFPASMVIAEIPETAAFR